MKRRSIETLSFVSSLRPLANSWRVACDVGERGGEGDLKCRLLLPAFVGSFVERIPGEMYGTATPSSVLPERCDNEASRQLL